MSKIVETIDLWKIYRMGKGVEVAALRGLNLAVEKGEFVAVTGPSGSGKSTFLHIAGCMDKPTRGDVLFEGRSVAKMRDRELTHARCKEIGFIFQTFNLLPTLSAFGNVEIPMRMAGANKTNRKERAKELLIKVGLGERLTHLPREMSGGEQQRVAIARALANNPKLLLADEPTGNLDSTTGREIASLLQQLNKEGQTIIMVTHNLEIAQRASRIIQLRDGTVIESRKAT